MSRHDEFADWVESPYRRQLDRQLREFVGPDADAVLSLAIRIHARTDSDAGREILAELAQLDSDDDRREMLGRIARIAYLSAMIWALRVARSDVEPEDPDWRIDEAARAANWLMGRGDVTDR